MTHAQRAIVLFAHGSRDPQWSQPLEAVAARMRTIAPDTPVHCAYLELMAPALPQCVATLVAAGARSVVVVPMFLGVGRHARQDLPQLVQELAVRYPAVSFQLRRAIGEEPAIVEAMAQIALS